MRGVRSVAVFLGAGLVLGACGGGNDRLSKAEYIKKADEICKAAAAKSDAVEAPETEEEFEDYIVEVVKLAREEVKDLRALDGPKDDEDTLDSMYDSLEKALDMIEEDPAAAMEMTEDPFEESSEMAKEYGFKECGAEQ